jgi:hypothetical protein
MMWGLGFGGWGQLSSWKDFQPECRRYFLRLRWQISSSILTGKGGGA